jgi:hypothetical protein
LRAIAAECPSHSVTALIGNRTLDVGDQTWFYEKRAVDPVTRNVDVQAQLRFERGQVTLLSFY